MSNRRHCKPQPLLPFSVIHIWHDQGVHTHRNVFTAVCCVGEGVALSDWMVTGPPRHSVGRKNTYVRRSASLRSLQPTWISSQDEYAIDPCSIATACCVSAWCVPTETPPTSVSPALYLDLTSTPRQLPPPFPIVACPFKAPDLYLDKNCAGPARSTPQNSWSSDFQV